MPLLLVFVLVVLAAIALVPISIIQRYRMGTARQRARGWLIWLNLIGLSLSVVLFLVGASFTSIWVPRALTYTAAGLAGGGVLGIVGLWLTRWEPSIDALHFTPSRSLVLGITLIVAARVFYGVWRAAHTWSAGTEGGSWIVSAGVPGSMAAGAIVLGYYLAYWLGVRRRFRRHAARPIRRI